MTCVITAGCADSDICIRCKIIDYFTLTFVAIKTSNNYIYL